MISYENLQKATIDSSYLHSNSTTHSFLFGALAELVDNARDAGAKTLRLFAVNNSQVQGGYMMCFLDDGCGMDTHEATEVMVFGRSAKRAGDEHMIGMYGNGLKSASMRIGKDMIVFTKKNNVLTCILLSRSFLEAENLESIVVPVPSFNAITKQPVTAGDKHETEMKIIKKYSPFHTDDKVFEQFAKIGGCTGTLIVCYNLRLVPNGQTELNVTEDDILLRRDGDDLENDQNSVDPERRSFAAYAAILYSDPRMKIYIQQQKVRTRRIIDNLYKRKAILCTSVSFRKRAEHEAQIARESAESAKVAWHEAQGAVSEMQNKLLDNSKQSLAQYRLVVLEAEKRHTTYLTRLKLAEQKARDVKEEKMLRFCYGLNIADRQRDGLFVYNRRRLIRMYEREATVQQLNGRDTVYRGVVGVVDVNYSVLEPTHNKQDFANAKDFRLLKKLMSEGMKQYWQWVLACHPNGTDEMWRLFGYSATNWNSSPCDDVVYQVRRARELQLVLQCDACLKWRRMPFCRGTVGKEFSSTWTCADSYDPHNNSCQAKEEREKICEENLNKRLRTTDDKVRENEEKIRVLQEKQKRLEEVKLRCQPATQCISEGAVLIEAKGWSRQPVTGRNNSSALEADNEESKPKKVKIKTSSTKSARDIASKKPSGSRLRTADGDKARATSKLSRISHAENRLGHCADAKLTPGWQKNEITDYRKDTKCKAKFEKIDVCYTSELNNILEQESSASQQILTIAAATSSTSADLLNLCTTAKAPGNDNSCGPVQSESTIKLATILRQLLEYFAPGEYKGRVYSIQQLLDFNLTKYMDSYEVCLTKAIRERERWAQGAAEKELDNLKQATALLAGRIMGQPEEEYAHLHPQQLTVKVLELANKITS